MNSLNAFRIWLPSARRAGRMLVAATGLFVVAFTLRSTALLDRVVQSDPGPDKALQIRVRQLAGTSWRVEGTAPLWSSLEIGVGNRVLGRTSSGPEGAFDHELQLDGWAQRIWVRALSATLQEPLRAEAPLSWRPGTIAPLLDLCVYLEASNLLWLAGRATQHDVLSIEGMPQANPEHSITADRFGIIDVLIGAPDSSTREVHLRNTAGVLSPSTVCERVTPTNPPPVARTGLLDQRHDLVNSISSSAVDPRGDGPLVNPEVINAMFPEEIFSIALPAAHPYLRAFSQGGMTATDFFTATFGKHDVLDAETIALVRTELGRLLPSIRTVDLAPRSDIRIRGEVATVNLTLRSFAAYFAGEIRFSPGSGRGIAARPLLTEHDRLTFRTGPGWHYATLPSEFEDGSATWRGPWQAGEAVAFPPASLSLLELPQVLQSVANRRDQDRKPETIGNFLKRFEEARQQGLGTRLWRVMLLLIPFASVWWILGRSSPNTPAGHRALLGLTSALAIAQCWPLISEPAVRLVPALTRSTAPILLAITNEPPQPDRVQRIVEYSRSLPAVASWTVFVTLVGLAPIWFFSFARLPSTSSGTPLDAAPTSLPKTADAFGRRPLRGARLALPASLLLVLATGYVAGLPAGQQALRHVAENLPSGLPIPGLEAGDHEFEFLAALIGALLWSLLILLFGARGVLLSVAYLSATAFFYVFRRTAWDGLVLLALALFAWPLLSRLFGEIFQHTVRRRVTQLVAIAFALVCIFGIRMPAQAGVALSAALLGLGFLWITAAGLGRIGPAGEVGTWLDRSPFVACALFAAAGVAIGWPFVPADGVLRSTDIATLLDHWDNLFPTVLAVGLALVLWEHIASEGSQVLAADALLIGTVFYAVFLVGPTTTWLFLPIPWLVAIGLARSWVFRSDEERYALQALRPSVESSERQRVADYVQSHSLRRSIEAAKASLFGELQKAKVTPDEFMERLSAYRGFEAKVSAGTFDDTNRLFALGDIDFPRNVIAVMQIGLLLASVPLVISLYQHLPVSRVDYPFPILAFVIFVLLATLKWGLFAAFFGLLYPNLRGDTGLSKGVHFFLALAIPLAVPYILGASTIDDLRPFALWLTQLFVFCSLLGLLAGDLRLLRKSGFHLRDLQAVHRVAVLSALASSVAAAIVPAVLAVIAGRVADVVKVFIELVIPAGPVTP